MLQFSLVANGVWVCLWSDGKLTPTPVLLGSDTAGATTPQIVSRPCLHDGIDGYDIRSSCFLAATLMCASPAVVALS